MIIMIIIIMIIIMIIIIMIIIIFRAAGHPSWAGRWTPSRGPSR